VDFLISATFDEVGRLTGPALPPMAARLPRRMPKSARPHEHRSTMPDHSVVPRGIEAYLRDVPLLPAPPVRRASSRAAPASQGSVAKASAAPALVNGASVLAFGDGLPAAQREAVVLTLQFAQRAANAACDPFTESAGWYRKYVEVLQNLGWDGDELAFRRIERREAEYRLDRAALAALAPLATQEQVAALEQALTDLREHAGHAKARSLLVTHANDDGAGRFLLGSVTRTPAGPAVALVGCYYRGSGEDFLVAPLAAAEVNVWLGAQRMTLNMNVYAHRRAALRARIGVDASGLLAAYGRRR
jgi:hypothetical protein